MNYTHLLILLLITPVCPHISSVDAWQHHSASQQHHEHRLLSIPKALLFTTFIVKKQNDKPQLPLCFSSHFDRWYSVIHT